MDQVSFVSVTVWTTETQQQVDDYLEEFPTPWIMGRDSGGLRTSYDITGTPTMFLFDKSGDVIEKFVGFTDKETLSYYFELNVRGNTLATLPQITNDIEGGSNNESIIGRLFQNPIFQMSVAFAVIIGIYVRTSKRS